MARSALVAYATKNGSTMEVAEFVGAKLRELGIDVDLRPAREVEELQGYDGVVLGTALYLGKLHRDASRFLTRNRSTLSGLPFAVFAMGPHTLEEHDVMDSRRQLEHGLAAIPEVAALEIAIFGGVVDPKKLRFPFNHLQPSDARDWDSIERWADRVAADLVQTADIVPVRIEEEVS